MAEDNAYVESNDGKTNFAGAYNQPDPRAYYNNLKPLEYIIPEQAKPMFEVLIGTFKQTHGLEQVQLLDVGCSYGVNAALLKYDLHIEDLYNHYCSSEAELLSRDKLLDRDAHMLEGQQTDASLHVIGLDACDQAVEYALRAGYLDRGVVADLETGALSSEGAESVKDVDLIISTGCVGYVTGTTFSRLFEAVSERKRPWVVSFVLRMFPYEPIRQVLGARGLATEKVTHPVFVQRRFETEQEQQHVVRRLESLEIDPTGKETEGYYYANLFVSRPEPEVKEVPLWRILEDKLETRTATEIL